MLSEPQARERVDRLTVYNMLEATQRGMTLRIDLIWC